MTSDATTPGLLRDAHGRILREAVEYSVVEHCNLRCAGCDHSSPHLTERFSTPEAFAADMEALSRHLHVRVLRILGGEPLLHPKLGDFVRLAREIAIADQLMLWTNGVLLHRVERALLESFDVVRVSLYPGVECRANLAELARDLQAAGRTRLEVVHVNRFQHQLLNRPTANRKLVHRTYLRCKEAHALSCHTVHDGRYYKCPKASLLEQRLQGCGTSVSNRSRDGVALHQNPRLGEDLGDYLLSSEPLMACEWCLGTDGTSFAHHQLDKSGLRAEREVPGPDQRPPFAHPARQMLRDLLGRL